MSRVSFFLIHSVDESELSVIDHLSYFSRLLCVLVWTLIVAWINFIKIEPVLQCTIRPCYKINEDELNEISQYHTALRDLSAKATLLISSFFKLSHFGNELSCVLLLPKLFASIFSICIQLSVITCLVHKMPLDHGCLLSFFYPE